MFGVQLTFVHWQRGTLGQLVASLEVAVAENPGLPAFAAVLALAYVEAGLVDNAHHLLEEFAATDLDLPLDGAWTTGMALYAEAAIECRDRRFTGPLFDRLAPWADQLSYSGSAAEGPVSHFLAGLATILGRYDEAESYFAQSAEMNKRMLAKFFAARTNLGWGKMLAERNASGDIDKARDLLTEARNIAATYGYANVERRAAQSLQHVD